MLVQRRAVRFVEVRVAPQRSSAARVARRTCALQHTRARNCEILLLQTESPRAAGRYSPQRRAAASRLTQYARRRLRNFFFLLNNQVPAVLEDACPL